MTDEQIKKFCKLVAYVGKLVALYEARLNASYILDTGKYMFDDNGELTEEYLLYADEFYKNKLNINKNDEQ